jgi:hypothetical protein
MPEIPPGVRVIGTWPKYADTGVFVPLTLCADCAERHFNAMKGRQDGCHKDVPEV